MTIKPSLGELEALWERYMEERFALVQERLEDKERAVDVARDVSRVLAHLKELV